MPIVLALFFLLVLIGLPIFFSLGLASAFYLFLIDQGLTTLIQRMFSVGQSTHLMAIPLFILAGEIINSGGMSKRLLRFSEAVVGGRHGGLALVAIVVSMIFAGVSGSAVADAAAVGAMLIPAMRAQGYSGSYSAGVIAAAGTIGVIIPPSIPMILYGWLGGVSVGKLFLAGIVPGILVGVGLMILSSNIAKKRDYPKGEPFQLPRLFKEFKGAFLALLSPVIILGAILGGIATTTEAAVIAVFYSLIIGLFIYRELRWSHFREIFYHTVVGTSVVMMVIAVANAFAWIIAFEQIPQVASETILGITENKYLILLMINVFLLIIGTFLDMSPAVLIFTPVLLPLVTQVGVDPLHFGVIMVINLAIGLCTPPVGTTLFTATKLANVKIEATTKDLLPYYAVMIAILLLVTYIPQLSLFLPNWLMG